MKSHSLLTVPDHRVGDLRAVLERIEGADRIALSTHVNADGDGAGSEAAMAAWLEERGTEAMIINPTAFPDDFRFLLHRPDLVVDWEDGGREALERADLLLVLDTSEPKRCDPLVRSFPRDRTLVIDHHPPGPSVLADLGVMDPGAAATGELIYDLISLAGGPWPEAVSLGLYVALVTDTGSFRYANTTPRTHALAGDLIARGVDPEAVFQRLYATVPRRRLELLRLALATLTAEGPIAWMAVTAEMLREANASPDDLDDFVEYPRSLAGTEVALLFRTTSAGQIKVSFRSNGNTDVSRIARQFGGGGHVKASGATLELPLEEVVERVVEVVREEITEPE